MFYVLTFESEVIADLVRGCYEAFKAAGMFTGEDLTYRERKRRTALMTMMKEYWGRERIPLNRF
jgi:hypothetical protein